MSRKNAALRRRFRKAPSCSITLLFTVALTACGSIGAEPQGPSDDREHSVDNASTDDDGSANHDGTGAETDGNTSGAEPSVLEKCAATAAEAKAIISTHCASCHGPAGSGEGRFSTILDVNALVTSGKVRPGKPDESLLYLRMSTGSMPPSKKTLRPSVKEVATIRSWITCNAPDWDVATPNGSTVPFMSIDERLTKLLADVKVLSNPVDRRRVRYLDMSHLSNAGLSADKVNEYRESVALLLNSLSYGAKVKAPKVVKGTNDTIFRIDLRDFGFSAEDWENIVRTYPYGVRYDEDSAKFPFLETVARQLRDETDTDVPFIQVDWLLTHASQPPLYYEILKFPRTLSQIAASRGINLAANLAAEELARAGFASSGVSVNNRIIERHEQPGGVGAFWLSHDFANNVGDSNIFANPLDFRQAGGEAFFNLPNGLQAYILVDAAGNLLDKGPTNIVTDPHSRDRAVIAGLSCMSSCHFAEGIIPKSDAIRAIAQNFGGVDADNDGKDDENTILRIYPSQAEMTALTDADKQTYTQARTALGVVKITETTMMRLVNTHLDTMDIDTVAANLGITAESLRSSLNNPRLPDEVRALSNPGGTIHRDVYETLFNQLITQVGLGTPLGQ